MESSGLAAVERNAVALGVSETRLLEASGAAVAREVRSAVDAGASVRIVAGRGSTGGRALAAARYLDDYGVSLTLVGRPATIRSPAARDNWEALRAAEYDADVLERTHDVDFGSPDAVVDGVGAATDSPSDLERAAAEAVDGTDATTVALVPPSGASASVERGTGGGTEERVDTADRVVAFHEAPPALQDRPGVTVADVGIPPAAETFVGPGDLERVRQRLRAAKRPDDSGRILVIGGGPYTGAPALSARAALHAGADLAFVAVPESIADPVRGYAADLIVQPYEGAHLSPEHVEGLVETATDHDDVVVIGPGLGDADETLAAVRQFLRSFDGNAVVDADALPAVTDVETDATLALTPNPEELVELGGPDIDDVRVQRDAIREFAADLGHTLVVKEAESVVADGDRARVVREGATGMTVGGTGDVLSGTVAAAFGVASAFEAACAGAYLKGRAGALLDDRSNVGFVASDVVEAIPDVLAAVAAGDE